MTTNGIRRAGPPQAVQRLRENLYSLQVLLSAAPSADWKRLFYDLQRDAPPDFPARGIDVSGTVMRFRSEPDRVAERIGLIDKWIERANLKESSFGARSEQERQRREELHQEHEELARLNAGWEKL